MGWGNCGIDSKGRPIGYIFEATCDHPNCLKVIEDSLMLVETCMVKQNTGVKNIFV